MESLFIVISMITDDIRYHTDSAEKIELVPVETISLTTLKTDGQINGSFGLFGGYIDEVEYLFFLTPSKTGYNGQIRDKVKMVYCEIIQTDSIEPCIIKNDILVKPKQEKQTWLYFLFHSNDSEQLKCEEWSGSMEIKPYKVYIPVGSIITKIQIQ